MQNKPLRWALSLDRAVSLLFRIKFINNNINWISANTLLTKKDGTK